MMDRESAGFFEEFDEVARRPDTSSSCGPFTVRPARMQDADALGRLSAAREGDDALKHSVSFKRAIEGDGSDRSPFILVAETEINIIGYGKVRFFSKERGVGEGILFRVDLDDFTGRAP